MRGTTRKSRILTPGDSKVSIEVVGLLDSGHMTARPIYLVHLRSDGTGSGEVVGQGFAVPRGWMRRRHPCTPGEVRIPRHRGCYAVCVLDGGRE